MRIVSSNIQLTAQRAYTSSHQVTERLREWAGNVEGVRTDSNFIPVQ